MVKVKYEGSLETLSLITEAINNVLIQLKGQDEITFTDSYPIENSDEIYIDLTDFYLIMSQTNFRTAYNYLVNVMTNSLFKYIITNYKLVSKKEDNADTSEYILKDGQDLYTYLINKIKKELSSSSKSINPDLIFNAAMKDGILVEGKHSKESFKKRSSYPNNDFKNFKKIDIEEPTHDISNYLDIPKEKLDVNQKRLSYPKSTKTKDFKAYFNNLGELSHTPVFKNFDANKRFSFDDILDSYIKTCNKKNPIPSTDALAQKDSSKSLLTEFLRKKQKNTGKGQKSYSLEDTISIVTHFYLTRNEHEFLADNSYYHLVCNNHSLNLSEIVLNQGNNQNIAQYFNLMDNHNDKKKLNKDRINLNEKVIEIVNTKLVISHSGRSIPNYDSKYAYKILNYYFNFSFTYLLEYYSLKLQNLTFSLIKANINNKYTILNFKSLLNSLDSITESINKKSEFILYNSHLTTTQVGANLNNLQHFSVLQNNDSSNHSLLMNYQFSIYPNLASLFTRLK
ncbi:hypothetical protein I7830_05640 [Mammaliicoccus sciuri]|uniref:hypothetical protein n=1 Tax=Mammaliicoccus sciuri TaxID=1296 RepID=UPI0018DCA778|nr:hypothetical protein [Mammaliicoccus sciuri]QPW15744.1 hypothetical protein I7830_05640 [Mammaliicoccus sciuri]